MLFLLGLLCNEILILTNALCNVLKHVTKSNFDGNMVCFNQTLDRPLRPLSVFMLELVSLFLFSDGPAFITKVPPTFLTKVVFIQLPSFWKEITSLRKSNLASEHVTTVLTLLKLQNDVLLSLDCDCDAGPHCSI